MFAEWKHAARQMDRVFVVVDAGRAYQGGFGQSGSGRKVQVSLSVVHVRADAEVDIETSAREPWPREFDDWRLTTDWLHRALRPEDIRFPLRVEADRWEQPVAVDDAEHTFTFIGNSTSWVASGLVGGARIGLSARGWPSEALALRSVSPRDVADEVPDRRNA